MLNSVLPVGSSFLFSKAGLLGERGGSAPAWTPDDLATLAIALHPALSLSQGKLWQNAAKTTPATANGHPVRVATCPFTGLDMTAPSDAARPTLTDEGGGKWSLDFDGTDDVLVGPSIAVRAVAVAAAFDQANFNTINYAGLFTGASSGDDIWLIGGGGGVVFFDSVTNFDYYRLNGTGYAIGAMAAPLGGVAGTCVLQKTAAPAAAAVQFGKERNNAARFWDGPVFGGVVTTGSITADLASVEAYLTALRT